MFELELNLVVINREMKLVQKKHHEVKLTNENMYILVDALFLVTQAYRSPPNF